MKEANLRSADGRRTFKERIVHNFRELVAMFLYLWLLFALFTWHKAIILAQYDIDFKPFGLAFINAFYPRQGDAGRGGVEARDKVPQKSADFNGASHLL